MRGRTQGAERSKGKGLAATASDIATAIAPPLLAWFDEQARDLPWRRGCTPYRTLVSELMLQQTVVATVIPYFERFVARWPDLAALGAAHEDDVLAMWSGLGYYARARNLHRAARVAVERHGGTLPSDEPSLSALPGVGAYTAAAVAAIAFGRRTFALDGNAARVVARLSGIAEAIDQPATRARLRAVGETWVPATRAGAFAEAVMELGATVCTPRAPDCAACPLRQVCRARATGRTAEIPARTPRAPKRVVRLACARVHRAGRVLLVRSRTGLLAGTWGLPASELPGALEPALRSLGVTPRGLERAGEVRHVFTHRDVTATVFDVAVTRVAAPPKSKGETPERDTRWVARGDLATLAVSSFLRKLLAVPSAAPARLGRARLKGDKRAESP